MTLNEFINIRPEMCSLYQKIIIKYDGIDCMNENCKLEEIMYVSDLLRYDLESLLNMKNLKIYLTNEEDKRFDNVPF